MMQYINPAIPSGQASKSRIWLQFYNYFPTPVKSHNPPMESVMCAETKIYVKALFKDLSMMYRAL